jgi:hypothetical protein
VIDQAKGILMGRHGMSADAAFDLLSKESQLANRTLRDIALDSSTGSSAAARTDAGNSARVFGRDITRAGDRNDSRAQPARRRRRDER